MSNQVDKLNGIALTSIEKLNTKTDANIEKLNGSSLYYAILRCQDKEKPRFIYV